MSLRVAVDIGGTFTDLVHLDEETGAVGLAKAATTPRAFEEGVMDAVGQTALDDVVFLAHGTTVVINALTERKGARVALITTAGFRDVLEIAQGQPARPLQLRLPQAARVRAPAPALRGRGAARLPGARGGAARRGERASGRAGGARRRRRRPRDLPPARLRQPGARATRGGDRPGGVAGRGAVGLAPALRRVARVRPHVDDGARRLREADGPAVPDAPLGPAARRRDRP